MSLRARILGGIGVIVIVLAIVTAAITTTTRRNLLRQVDRQLASAVTPVKGIGDEFRPSRFPPPPKTTNSGDGTPNSGLTRPDQLSSLYVGTLVDEKMETLVSPKLLGQDPPVPMISVKQVESGAATGEPFIATSTDSGPRFRMLAYRDDRSGSIVVLGTPIDSVDKAIADLVLVEAIGTGVILAALALLAWWVIHLGVRPIKAMTTVASSIAQGDLSHRVPDAAAGTEAGELGNALNQMLGQIEATLEERARIEERLRRFVADASHELRTPIATIRGYAELYRTGGLKQPGVLDDAMTRTESEAIRMGTLVQDLLQLASLDEGRPMAFDTVDLAPLITDAATDARMLAPARTISVSAPQVLEVIGDELRLRQVLANIVANALVHTPEGTPVELLADCADDKVTLRIVDHGEGMEAEAAERAFERFYRADPARVRNRGGTGLGLSIVAAIVAAHKGSVSLESTPGGGTTVKVVLPSPEIHS